MERERGRLDRSIGCVCVVPPAVKSKAISANGNSGIEKRKGGRERKVVVVVTVALHPTLYFQSERERDNIRKSAGEFREGRETRAHNKTARNSHLRGGGGEGGKEGINSWLSMCSVCRGESGMMTCKLS